MLLFIHCLLLLPLFVGFVLDPGFAVWFLVHVVV